MVSAAGVLAIASLSFLIAHIGYVITLGVAARLGEGVLTAFSYAFMGFNLVFALMQVRWRWGHVGPLAEHWDRRAESLTEHVDRVVRGGL
jgi:peptidoglycan biosynthesis protein MviN/MurJ (putative lipid II flippase)